MSEKVLFVDDDPNILAAYQRTLRKLFQIDTARGGELGLAAIAQHGPYAVIVTDMQMPQMDGVQFLRRAQDLAPDSVRMMLTGNADQHTAIEAVNAGRIFRFMNKPCPPEQFTQTLQDGIRQYRLIHAEKELLEKTLSGSVRVLTEILSVVDPQSFGYAETLKRSMRPLAEALKVAEVWEWEIAAMLSQIGYVTIPPAVIGKARSGKELAEVEAKMLLRVPEIGHHLLANIPRLESVARIVLYQNKRFDGVGFPADAVAGEQIPLAARVLKIVSDLAQIEVQKIPRARAFEMMAGRAGWYDDRALAAAVACLGAARETEFEAGRKSRAVALAELKIGEVLLADVTTADGLLLLATGNRISDTVFERLRNFSKTVGIKEPIYVVD